MGDDAAAAVATSLEKTFACGCCAVLVHLVLSSDVGAVLTLVMLTSVGPEEERDRSDEDEDDEDAIG